jgi:hypothetical protein
MTSDGLDALGLYFGTTSGEVWARQERERIVEVRRA